MAAKKKSSKTLSSKRKTFYRNPAFIGVVAVFVAAGVFLTFNTFAAGSPTAASSSTKDQYGCPWDYTKRPNLSSSNGNRKHPCVRTAQSDIDAIYRTTVINHAVYRANGYTCGVYLTGEIAIDGDFGPLTGNAIKSFQIIAMAASDGITPANAYPAVDQRVWKALHACSGN